MWVTSLSDPDDYRSHTDVSEDTEFSEEPDPSFDTVQASSIVYASTFARLFWPI
jgi:hypothetical protein